jgi:hypothetical protein
METRGGVERRLLDFFVKVMCLPPSPLARWLCAFVFSRPVVEARKRMTLVVRLQMIGGGVEGL